MPNVNDPLQQYNNKAVTVYKLKNTITGKIYVRVTQNTIEQRFKAHVNAKNAKLRNKQRLPYFLRSLHKYGENVWEKEQLCKCDNVEEAYQKEIYFINKLNSFGKNGYNSTIGGEGCHGRVMTDEQKEKLRQRHIGMKGSIEKMRATKIKNGTHAGAKNIKACRCEINGVQYGCIKDACGELSMTEKQIRYRLDSDKYSNFIRI